jgi:hypothetical protein
MKASCWIVVMLVAAVLTAGCATGKTGPPVGPQVAPTLTPAPHVEVESAGPATVEMKAPTDVSTEAARPVTDLAPRLEALGDAVQMLSTRIEAMQKTVNGQNAALGGIADKIGVIQGDLSSTVEQFDLSDRQLELEKAKAADVATETENRARTDRIEKAGLAAGILIAAALDGPKTWWGKALLAGLGVLSFAAVLFLGIL